MNRLLYILTLFLLLSCSKEQETRIFTVTVNAIPPEGGTVTLIQTQSTTGEYRWGENANVKARPSEGYEFSHWTANTYIGGIIETSWGTNDTRSEIRTMTSVSMRCYGSKTCSNEIIINGHFAKKN